MNIFMFLLLASSPVKYAASIFYSFIQIQKKINLHLSYIKKYSIKNVYHTFHLFYDWNLGQMSLSGQVQVILGNTLVWFLCI